MKRAIIILVIVIALGVAGYFGYQAWQKNQAAAAGSFQTAQVTRGGLTALVGATGTVRANQSGVVSWTTSGRIGKLNVGTGDLVSAGQVLAELDPKSLSQAVILAQADLVTARRNLSDLQNSDVARARAQQALVAAQKELDDATTDRASLNYKRASNDTIDAAHANLGLAQNEVDKAQEFFDQVKNRPETDELRAQALSALANAKKKRDTNQANYNWLVSGPDQVDIDTADARVEVAKASLADAQREVDRLSNGVDPEDIRAAEARVTAIEATLDMVNMEAPFAGTITEARSKLGDEVAPGSVTFRIDDLSHLLVDVQVTEVDINRIKVGQDATLTFDAIQSKTYNGKVVEVARVGVSAAGVVNFTVTIELTDADDQVYPGMTAAVNIVTNQLEDVLLVPNRAVRLRDGKRVVYLLQNGVPTPVEITLGLTSDQSSELLGGAKEGDTLVLNPPLEFQAGGPPPGMRGN
ncbi:MAG TPA: efflux RND transporter periplasmic adaptor subunit [Anaerolinea sp.]|nr:efflux RND transporter periplasmic adaptor subunit [Anaerolinea sp.]